MKKVIFLIAFFFVVSFLMFSGSLEARLPDLTIEKITVDKKCHLVVVVKNKGPGNLPNNVYTVHHPKSAGVYVYINGKGWGGQSIWKFDPGRNLQQPGGMATYISRYVVGTTPIEVKAVVDLHNDVTEAIETNNSKVRRGLKCRIRLPKPGKPSPELKLPDLTVLRFRKPAVLLTAKIRRPTIPEVWIKNIGYASASKINVDLFITKSRISMKRRYKESISLKKHLWEAKGYIASLGPGQSEKPTFRKSIVPPKKLPPGKYYFCAYVDRGNKINEMLERNNLRVESFHIEGISPKIRPLNVWGVVEVEITPFGNISRILHFLPIQGGTLAHNLFITVDGIQIPELPNGYSLSQSFNFKGKKSVSISIQYPPNAGLITASGKVEQPVTILSPSNNNAIINPNSDLTVTWTHGTGNPFNPFKCIIRKVDVNGQAISGGKVYTTETTGTSITVPAKVFEPNTRYRVDLHQILNNITITGSVTSNSKILHIYYHYRLFRTL